MGAYKDEKRSTWYAKFKYKDWKGETKWITKRGFPTKREALDYEREFMQQKAGDLDMTFASFVEKYKQELFPRIKYSTTLTKINIIDKHLTPYFGKKKLSDITKKDVIAWQNEVMQTINPRTGEKYSKSFLKTVHNQLSAILNYAVKYYDLKDNVASKVGNMGSEDDLKIDFWSKEEYMKFREEAMEKPFFYYCFEVLYWTGIREGELLALTPADVDLENGEIRINKTYHHLEGKDIVTTPKTKKSNRTVSMPSFLTEELKDYMKMIYKPRPDDRMFPTCKSALARELKSIAKKAGVKKIRVHDLRHSHVSLLIATKKFNLVEIADRVGHESIEITLKYSHLLNSAGTKIATALDDIAKEE